MSEDALKALLQTDMPPPARDVGFVIAVMERVERRRLVENLLLCLCSGGVVTALLALVMPYITPALIAFGRDIIPAVVILATLGMVAVGVYYLRPALRDFGIRL